MEIYRGNVLANRRGTLRATYPVVCRLVGDAFFDEAAARYAGHAPSRSGDLHEYGDAFANFLEGYAHARSLPYLADVARLEWACHECYHAADAGAFDFAALARVPAERHAGLRFLLHPSTRLLRSSHPVAAIMEANQPDRDGTPGAGSRDPITSWSSIARASTCGSGAWTPPNGTSSPRSPRARRLGDASAHTRRRRGRTRAHRFASALRVRPGVIAGFAPFPPDA